MYAVQKKAQRFCTVQSAVSRLCRGRVHFIVSGGRATERGKAFRACKILDFAAG